MNNDVAIIMCTWKRINKLQKTINLLKNQTYKNFDFYIWNNNNNIKNIIDKIIIEEKKNINIDVKHSQLNVGGFGRFLFAKEIHDKYKSIIFIDDDQIFNKEMVDVFIKSYKPKTICSWYSFKLKNNYWDRFRVGDKVEADYCGTGGMIVDSDLFSHDLIYEIPEKYKFVEDLWLSFIAKEIYGWKLYGLDVNIKIEVDGKDQYSKLRNLKNEFYSYLLQNKNNLKKDYL
jgi:hypothetical protein